jgi:hypothetical protein
MRKKFSKEDGTIHCRQVDKRIPLTVAQEKHNPSDPACFSCGTYGSKCQEGIRRTATVPSVRSTHAPDSVGD